MSNDDPFSDFDDEPADVERTIILPAPGGRRRSGATAPVTAPRAAPERPQRPGGPSIALESATANPLVGAAATAFALVRRLRNTASYGDVPALRDSVLATIRDFEATARRNGASQEAAYAGRYALCALIDETVMSTPWGSHSIWNSESLLATLHNETRGGAKFFQILDRMLQNPARNIDLLELLFHCLTLGFQGQFAVADRGAAKLEEMTNNLYRTIRNQRGEPERELSPHWQGVQDRGPAVARYIPLWVVPIAVCALAVVLFLGFSYSVNRASDDVFITLNSLGREAAQLHALPEAKPILIETRREPDAPAPPRPAERIRGLLQDEVAQGLVDVVDQGSAVNVVVHNKGLFASGSATVSETYRPLIVKIGRAVNPEAGPITVIGHTDSQPIRSLKFPSNWHLSSARAKSVQAVVSQAVEDSGKVQAEGRADTEPVADNGTAAGRQANRRIEIRVVTR